MVDDVLKQLQDLAAIPELKKGFETQRDCIAWGNKILPLLSFNAELQNEFISYQKNINTLGLSADLQSSSLHQMISILHLAISERQKVQSNTAPISDKVLEYADRFEDINNMFVDRGRSLHLNTEDEAYFKQQVLEVISLINETLGDKNQYTASIYNTVNSNRGMYGPSRHCVQSIRGIVLAAQTEIKRKESAEKENPQARMIESDDAKQEVVADAPKLENLTLRDLFKLPIPTLVKIGTFILAMIGSAFYFGYNVKTWQTDKVLYDLNKENRQLKDKLENLQPRPPIMPPKLKAHPG